MSINVSTCISLSINTECDCRLTEIGEKLVAGGGRLTDRLDDPTLTHIIVGSNTSRFVMLVAVYREIRLTMIRPALLQGA